MTFPNVVFKIGVPTLICSRDEETGRPRIEGIASSTVVDSHGDEITLQAQRKMVASARGMTIFMNHGYSVPNDVFGTVSKAALVPTDATDAKTGKPIYDMRIGVDVAESNKIAMDTWTLMSQDKVKLGLSVGAMIPEGGASFNKERTGLVIDDIDLIEASVVSVPANPRSFVDYAVKSLTGKFPERVNRKSLLEQAASDIAGEEVTETEGDEDPAEAVAKALEAIVKGADEVADEAVVDEPEEPTEDTTTEDTTVEKTKVSIWETDEGKTIEVDTGRNKPKSDGSQSAQDDSPETSGGSSSSKAVGDPTVLASATAALGNSSSIIASLTAQLRASRDREAELTERLARIVELSTKTIRNAAEIVEKVGKLPAGRSTGYVEVKDAAAKLPDVYGEDVRKILRTAIVKKETADAIHG